MTDKQQPKTRKSEPRRHVSAAERMTIIQLWMSGQGKVGEIAEAMRRPPSTIYNVLIQAGLWPGFDDYTKAGARNYKGGAPQPKPKSYPRTPVDKPMPVEMIEPPKLSVWQRIQAFFS